jgi:hypothetical protein
VNGRKSRWRLRGTRVKVWAHPRKANDHRHRLFTAHRQAEFAGFGFDLTDPPLPGRRTPRLNGLVALNGATQVFHIQCRTTACRHQGGPSSISVKRAAMSGLRLKVPSSGTAASFVGLRIPNLKRRPIFNATFLTVMGFYPQQRCLGVIYSLAD